jgi:predicted amidophosphoribosyltransferase
MLYQHQQKVNNYHLQSCYKCKVIASLKSLKELLFPISCISCAAPDYWLCSLCQKEWKVSTKKSYIGRSPLYYKTGYSNKTAAVILSAKENNHLAAVKLLAESISQSILYAIEDLEIKGDISLVTIPSSPSAIRRRGRNHIQVLAVEVQKYLGAKAVTSNILTILTQRKNTKDQSGLNSRQRIENTYEMFRATSCENSQGAIFLIDDLVTTGASIMEGIRALFEAKITVTASITACAVGRNSLIP